MKKDKFSRENIKANIDKIKVALGIEEETQEDVQLEDVKKVDGTILRIEPAIEVGATVQVIAEDGELVEAPDGEHELESGDVIKTEGGVIIEVIMAEGSEEVVEEEMSEVEETEPQTKAIDVEALTNNVMNRLNEAITDKINNLKFASIEKVEALEKENSSLKESVIQLCDLVEAFSETEKETPSKKVKNPFKKDVKEFDFSKIGEALRNNKK